MATAKKKKPAPKKAVSSNNPNLAGSGSEDPWLANYQAAHGAAGSSAGGGSGGSGSGATGTGSIDYSNLFAYFGMTPDMIKQINNMMAQYISSGMDETTAYGLIVGAIRGGQIGGNYKNGQSWYQYTYQGISYGMANGLLDSSNPEASYRQYVSTVDQYYQEYFGRNATSAEVLQFMQSGTSPDKVNAQLKGQSYANAYSNGDSNAMGYSWNALLGAFGGQGNQPLTAQQSLAMGESLTGYSNPLGDQLTKMLQTAQTRMQTIFKGTLATPADLQKGAQGLNAPSLSSEPTPDVAPI